MPEILARLSEAVCSDETPDRYGGGLLLEEFEAHIATLLGKEAAVFLPSGTMAQQIALRIHAAQTGNTRVALHPLSHLVVSEEDAYQRLSGLHGTLLGESHRLFTIDDLQGLKELPGSLLIELPERNIGGALRPWNELLQITRWARDHGIALHMDGARLWESQPYYDRPHAEIAALFDSVYVSFYKGLGGIAGAALAGPKGFIDESRLWQQRYGGRVVQQYPMILSARDGLKKHLPRMRAYRDRAVEIAAVISGFEQFTVAPNPPHTNMFHSFVRGDAAKLDAAMLQIAGEESLALFSQLSPSTFPGYSKFECWIGEGAFEVTDTELRAGFARLFSLSTQFC